MATTSSEYSNSHEARNPIADPHDTLAIKKDKRGKFDCSYCSLEEIYDYKGARPPFSKAICYLEDCYVMKDPFSQPNRGEVLVLGADCSVCKKPVCLGCSVFFVHRFCPVCAIESIADFPPQLHAKIKSLKKNDERLEDAE